ncbi:MAG TPA: DUF1080 domain-containing protein [Candidatus Hydrogenedentes bacterium]|nr:DUF1080 domain-containing protein [Candidatus Hydrogenedentota bacterium]HOC69156.1 DUF1080 domain-containing protein [Candidatus Hydrogenedentota bacterium]
MKMSMFVVTLLLTVTMAGARAEEDDAIMGNYQGAFTSPDWSSRYIRAQVVALSEVAHRAVLFIGVDEASAARLEIKGRTRDGIAEFKDTLTLDSLGGAHAFEARIEGETLTGTLKKEGALPAAFALKRVFLQPPTLGMAPPEGAVLLFDGSNTDLWERWPNTWCLGGDGSMEVCGSNFKTIAEYGGGTYHLEFRTPFMPRESGQGRGNSGVYVLGRYEVQVLDSFGSEPKDNLCGGIYQFAVPAVDAVLPPLQWQTYDITFTAPEFDTAGNKIKNARIHVLHNGLLIHDDVELASGTPGGISDQEAAAGSLLLQDHGNPVRFRNIWFKPAN